MVQCLDNQVSPEILNTARTLEDVYQALGVVRQPQGGAGLRPPVRIDPQDPSLNGAYSNIPAASFSYLTPNRSGFSVAALTTAASGSASTTGLSCVLSQLGYTAAQGQGVYTRVQEIRAQTADGEEQAAVDRYLASLPAAEQRNYEIYVTVAFMNQFNEGQALNTDGDASVISRTELSAWANGRPSAIAQAQGEKAVTRIHSLLGLATYLMVDRTPPPAPRTADARAGVTLNPTDTITLTAPNGDWRTGDQVFIDNVQWMAGTVPQNGRGNVMIPCSSLTVGAHRIEVRNGTSTWVTLPVTIQAAALVAPAPESTLGEVSAWWNRNWEYAVGGTAAATVLVTGIAALLRIRGLRAEVRTENAGRTRAEGEATRLRGEVDAAGVRVRDLSEAAAGARVEAGNARMAPDVRAQAEARVRDIEGELEAARGQLQQARSALGIRGKGKTAADARFDRAFEDVTAKETDLRAEQAVVRDMESRGVPSDDAGLISHRERVAVLEGELRTAQQELGQASHHNAPGRAQERARDAAVEAIREARAEVARIEAELGAARDVVARDSAAGQAFNLLGSRPRAVPPPLPPPAPAPAAPAPAPAPGP